MPGFISSISNGEEIVFAENADFSGNSEPSKTNGLQEDGQLWIGRTAPNAGGTNIDVATLTAGTGVTISNGAGSITIAASGAVGQTITGNEGPAIAPISGNWDLLTANSTPIFTGTAGTQTLDFGLNNLVLGTDLPALTVGTSNVGMGQNVYQNLTEGSSNVAIGNQSMDAVTTGSNNVAIGRNTLTVMTGSVQNVAIGASALQNLAVSTGSNTAVGYASLDTITTGTENIALGESAGGGLTTSDSSNICIGNGGVSGDNNTIRIGTQGVGAGQQDTTFIAGIVGTTVTGNFVKVDSSGQLGEISSGAIGQTITGNSGGMISPSSGNWNLVTSNSTVTFAGAGSTLTQNFGLSNLMLGASGSSITSAANNTGFGLNTLATITSGQENCAFGVNCLDSILGGSNNCGYGVANLAALTTSTNNACFGHNSGQLISTGSGGNSACGYQSLSQVTTGSFNTAIGYQAGRGYTGTESNNISIGNAVLGTAAESNTTRIGSTQTRAFVAGITGVTVASSQPVGVDSNGQLSSLSATINVNANGEVNLPLQPAFLGLLPSNDANATGNGTTYTLGGTTALTEVFDQNGDFTTGGVFTAPVAGRYNFTLQMRLSGITGATTMLVRINTSNRNYTYSTSIGSESTICACTTALTDMDAADTATFTVVLNGLGVDTATIVGNAAPFTYVCGNLVA